MRLSAAYYARRRDEMLRQREAGGTLNEIAATSGLSLSTAGKILAGTGEQQDFWRAPTRKDFTAAEREAMKPRLLALARAVQDGWMRAATARDARPAEPRSRAAGAGDTLSAQQ